MMTEPNFTMKCSDASSHFILDGDWTIEAGRLIEEAAERLTSAAQEARSAIIDLAAVSRIDTTGVWLLEKVRRKLEERGIPSKLAHNPPQFAPLFEAAGWREFSLAGPERRNALFVLLDKVGVSLVSLSHDVRDALALLGIVLESMARALLRPNALRFSSFIASVEKYGVDTIPVVISINLLVGGLLSQQAIYQLKPFGAEIFTVNLLGILLLRELSVLVTSVMVAARSGSAITAELGLMKMREEVDAIKVMGLSPIDVLVTPRIMALVFFMPILTFIADIAALTGGIVVSWVYAGITPDDFLSQLKAYTPASSYYIGLTKAPFVALVIGILTAMEGLRVQGSAESLGRHVTAAVTKASFMALIVGGIFDILFTPVK